jgi:hypothetical protein
MTGDKHAYVIFSALCLSPSVPFDCRLLLRDAVLLIGRTPIGKVIILILEEKPVTFCYYALQRRSCL